MTRGRGRWWALAVLPLLAGATAPAEKAAEKPAEPTKVIAVRRLAPLTVGLTGYGGGLERKRWLLAHEGVQDLRP